MAPGSETGATPPPPPPPPMQSSGQPVDHSGYVPAPPAVGFDCVPPPAPTNAPPPPPAPMHVPPPPPAPMNVPPPPPADSSYVPVVPPPPPSDSSYVPVVPTPDSTKAPPPPPPQDGAYAPPTPSTDITYTQPPPGPPDHFAIPPPPPAAPYSVTPSGGEPVIPQSQVGTAGYAQPPPPPPGSEYAASTYQSPTPLAGHYGSEYPGPAAANSKDPEVGHQATGDAEGNGREENGNLMLAYGAVIGLLLGVWGLFFLCCACCCAWVPQMQQNKALKTKWLMGWVGGMLLNVVFYGIVVVRRTI